VMANSSDKALLEAVVALIDSKKDQEAREVLLKTDPATMTQLVRDASNWAFQLDLQERAQQLRADQLRMLDDE